MNTTTKIMGTSAQEQKCTSTYDLCSYDLRSCQRGFILPLVIVVMVILIILAVGAMTTSYGSRLQAVQTKAQTEAMLAAEAGYEQGLFWMSKQADILGAIQLGGGIGDIDFGTSHCHYQVTFSNFLGARPVFHVLSTGTSGRPSFTRVVDVEVMQETSGWAMGSCRVPFGTSTTEVYFKNGEIVDMPLHINKYNDSPDVRDIWISTSGGSPTFLRKVEMGESRKTSGGIDKYSDVMLLFNGGIYFDQPGVRVVDGNAVTSKVNRFYNSTPVYRYTPKDPCTAVGTSTTRCSAVQLEFFVQGGVGNVRVTNDCTVCLNNAGVYDYNMVPGSGGGAFQQYKTYAYHYRPTNGTQQTISINDDTSPCYVRQTFGSYESELGGQIYVGGNVVIGGGEDTNFTDINNMVVKGKITIVAAGNIWVADSIKVDDNGGSQRDANGMPSTDNPNVLGLIAQGVVKVVNPRDGPSSSPSGLTYQPIGIKKSASDPGYVRYLPDPTVVEAAITVGGGGWGAEGVYNPGRREYENRQNDLIVRGSITEVVRGVVGSFNSSTGAWIDGYAKHYYVDTRLMSGILPGDIWFSGKYIPAPAGWHDRSIRD
jgi:hypothetical protein